MGLTTFQLQFDNRTNVFYAGGIVSGCVIVAVDKPKRTNGVFLKLFGEARVRWNETVRRDNDTTETEYFNADETYINSEICVHTPANSAQEIPVGRHVFPFRFQLPTSLPSSFESSWSNVRYSCTARIHRPWWFDHKVKQMLSVNAVYDLNTNYNNRVGVSQEDVKTRGCCCCESGPIILTVKLPKSGYAPGEFICPDITVRNTTDETVDRVIMRLEQEIINKTRKKNRSEQRVVSEIHLGLVNAGEIKKFSDIRMAVPALPPTNLGGFCRVIDVNYVFKVTVDPGTFSSNMHLPCYIQIGTIPLSVRPTPYPVQLPLIDVGVPGPPWASPSEASAPPLPRYEDLPPPSYEECMFGQRDVTGEDDDQNTNLTNKMFAPRYPMYTFGNPAT